MLMKGKYTKNALSLAVALFLLHIINSKKLSASASWLSPPPYKEERQRCGFESCYEKCPPGSCCSWSGYCGTTKSYCGREYCKAQCPFPPSGRLLPLCVHGRCGVQAEGEPECGRQGCYKKCPPGSCCSIWGYCGTTEKYCDPYRCQSQCPHPHPPPDASIRCGREAGYRKCPTGLCCSTNGWCGTTEYYCGKYQCQSQCPSPPPPPYASGRCGMQAGGRKCPTGLCCSSSGWCGTTEYYCAKQWCQS